MKHNRLFLRTLLAASGTAIGLAATANAQPYVVNTFGATLLTNLLTGQAVNNDYLDLDGDGNSTLLNGNPDNLVQNLSVVTPSAGFVPTNYFVHQYRSVGSVNGVQELVDWGCQADRATTAVKFAGVVAGEDQFTPGMLTAAANPATSNRIVYISNGVGSGLWFNNANPGSIPFTSATNGTYVAQPWQPNGTDSGGGTQNDAAPVDVPSSWAVTTLGTQAFDRLPSTPGYGTNSGNSLNKQGSTGADESGTPNGDGNFSNRLVDLPVGFNLYNGNPSQANNKTIFDTQIAWAPIPNYANYGTGISQLTYTQCQHLYVTGRLPSGENLTVVTRDSGSGTHNGHMNSFGIDPSQGVGENIGGNNNFAQNHTLGKDFIPGNKGSSSSLESTLRNVRLGVGYSGGERFANNSIWQYAEVLGLKNDLNGRTAGGFVRPTIDAVLDNGLIGETDPSTGTVYTQDGYRIGGKAIFATMGDPRQVPANRGGYGFIGGETNPGTPAMCNPFAAAWVNNISRSIEAFVTLPGGSATDFSPGEFVASQLFPIPGTDYLQTTANGTQFVVNPNYNNNLQTFLRTNTLNPYVTQASRYQTYGFSDPTLNGRVPNRTTGFVYSDFTPASSVGGSVYLLQDGTTETYADRGANFESRNRIAGDFDGNGLRNVNDITEMVKAAHSRNGGPAWVAPNGTGPILGAPGTKASIEILGDFNNDGNFGRRATTTDPVNPGFVRDTSDVRYFADGLAMNATTGKLDRKAGFTAVDTAYLTVAGSNNFFGTTLATPKAYAAGDARGDVSNAAGRVTKGYAPIGADPRLAVDADDNRIDAADVDHVSRQLLLASDRSINWATELSQAAEADLSADMTGDLIIDCNDVTEIVTVILGTQITDLNLDGNTNAADAAIAAANLGAVNAVWSQGDVNCDGLVTQADVDAINGGGGPVCDSLDFNNDGVSPDTADIDDFLSVFGGGTCSTDPVPGCNDVDFNNDGVAPDTLDIDSFLSVFGGGPCL
jgi:hypothetical protein